MIKKIERLDTEHEKIVKDVGDKLMEWLQVHVPPTGSYSEINMSLNILTICLFTIAYRFIEESNHEYFIKNISKTLKANFDANRKNQKIS